MVHAGGTATFGVINLPAGYDYFEFEIVGSSQAAGYAALFYYLNGDTTATNYWDDNIQFYTAVAAAQANNNRIGEISGTTMITRTWARLNGYASSSQHKTLNHDTNWTNGNYQAGQKGTSRWASNAVVTSIEFYISGANITAGSTLIVRGFKQKAVVTGLLGSGAGDLIVTKSLDEIRTVLSETILTATSGSLTTPTIDQTYDELEVILDLRVSAAVVADNHNIQFNGDTTAANYRSQVLFSTTSVNQAQADNSAVIYSTGSSSTANTFARSAAACRSHHRAVTRTDHIHACAESSQHTGEYAVSFARGGGR